MGEPRPRVGGRVDGEVGGTTARGIVALGISLALVLLVALGAELGLRFWAEGWLANRLESVLALPRRPDVSLGGFPFLAQFARGELSEVSVSMEDLEAEGLRAHQLSLDLHDVRFSRSDLLTGRAGSLEIGRGEGRVEVGERALNDLLEARGEPVSVELIGPRVRAVVTASVEGIEDTRAFSGRLEIRDGALAFSPGRGDLSALSFEAGLPELFPGLTWERVEVREAALTLVVGLQEAVVDVEAA